MAKTARAMVVTRAFWSNLGVAVAPFVIIAAVAWVIHARDSLRAAERHSESDTDRDQSPAEA